MTGKAYLNGVYLTDININSDELKLAQLVFFFSVSTKLEYPFKQLTLRVVLPGSSPADFEVPLSPPPTVSSGRTTLIVKAPMLLQQPILRPGKIETKVITESEEIDAGGFWINLLATQ
ncbi:hypothetical protein ACQR0Z_17455 [Bradyrhizobium sp. HKCCYLS3077]|uniref:hypothetical protein n=1 Tax=Bradyrhizobium sp. HKCCYLS3077 TaxID=3420761 RepID=UPI003EB94650